MTPSELNPRQRTRDGARLLREARGERGLREVANASGFNSGYLSNIENGHHAPSLANVERIARAYGIDTLRLVSAYLWPKPQRKPQPDNGDVHA